MNAYDLNICKKKKVSITILRVRHVLRKYVFFLSIWWRIFVIFLDIYKICEVIKQNYQHKIKKKTIQNEMYPITKEKLLLNVYLRTASIRNTQSL